MSDQRKLSVDGLSITAHSRTGAFDTSRTDNNELNDVRRKLEKKDAELKKRDKEVHSLQRELKSQSKDIQSLRENNLLLQQSLNYFREDVEKRMQHSRLITDLEENLEQANLKLQEKCSEMESIIKTNADLTEKNNALTAALAVEDGERAELKSSLYTAEKSIEILTAQAEEKNKLVLDLRKELSDSKRTNIELKGTIEQERSMLNFKEQSIIDLTEDIKKLKSILIVREETIASLRSQLDEWRLTHLILSPEEMKKYKTMQSDMKIQQDHIKELTLSVDRHVELLQKGEEEGSILKNKIEFLTKQNQEYQQEINLKVQKLIEIEILVKALHKEISDLKHNKKLLKEKLEHTQNICLNKNNDIDTLQKTIMELINNKDMELKLRKEEMQRRKVADEAAKSLRSRVSFLLEQMQQALALTVSWQEQKTVLKAEVCSLHKANLDVRKRLVALQRHYLARTISHGLGSSNNNNMNSNNNQYGQSTQNNNSSPQLRTMNGGSLFSPSSPFANLADPGTIDSIGETYDDLGVEALPTSAEAEVERCLFDAICAFTSGERKYEDKKAGTGTGTGRSKERPALFNSETKFILMRVSSSMNSLYV